MKRLPKYCEMEKFEFIELKEHEVQELVKEGLKEELIVYRGRILIRAGSLSAEIPESGKMDISGNARKKVTIASQTDNAGVFHAMGKWRNITSSGIFAVTNTGGPPDFDTPYDYIKRTSFDNHYHDCDEYWVVIEGEARVASENRIYEIGPGDCLYTRMGWHHDVLEVTRGTMLRAIWLEGTLKGRQRKGHLWEPRHGAAEHGQSKS